MRQKIYVESTVWYQMANFSNSELKRRVGQLFESANAGRYRICVSNVVLEELALNAPRYRKRIEELLTIYKPLVIMQNDETEDIANAYIENAFKDRDPHDVHSDALHAAAATTANISYMASWNWRNLLNVRYLENINSINILAGFNHNLTILPPFMFVDLTEFEGDRGTIPDQVWEIKRQYGKQMAEMRSRSLQEKADYHLSVTSDMAKRMGLEIIDVNRKIEYL